MRRSIALKADRSFSHDQFLKSILQSLKSILQFFRSISPRGSKTFRHFVAASPAQPGTTETSAPAPAAGAGESHREPVAAAASIDRSRTKKQPERIVIFRLGSLGDTVVSLPCLHKVAEVFPNAERIVLTNVPVSAKAAPLDMILANSALIDGVIDYPIGLRSAQRLWALRRRLRDVGATTMIYLAPVRGRLEVYRDIVFFWICGITRIIGAPTSKDLCEHRVDPVSGDLEPECSRLARTLAALGPIELADPANWDLRLTDRERAVGAKTVAAFEGRPYIAINMGGKAIENIWGDDNWRGLFRELSRTHGGYGLLIIGSADDAACVASVTESWPSAVVNACGQLAPRESAAALERADLFVGHNSGPMHLAAACGVTVVALFGNANPPRVWHPYGQRHRVIQRMQGIFAIKIADIAAAVREALPPSVDGELKLRLEDPGA